jgi:hypothetical protein
MEYRGRVKGGVIVLEEGAALEEGAEVRVRPVSEPVAAQNAGNGQTLGQWLMKFAGKAQGLPSDAARNHDHYLYGAPKR